MKYSINHATVLGSGIMGSRIACHLAGVGIPVLLLDRVYEAAPDAPAGIPVNRNQIVEDSLQAAIKSSPSPLYHSSFAKRIQTGNFEDNLGGIGQSDWIVEVIVEHLPAKQQLFHKIEPHRKAGSIISSNTSGIPIQLMNAGRTEDFRRHFCGTHFFNPPRYLKLLEIIPGPDTDPWVVDFMLDFGSRILGKTTVLARDTPAFIANRMGVFGIMALLNTMERTGLNITAVDQLTGPLAGRPKSATFRTCDVVGIDTLARVAKGVAEHCADDPDKHLFSFPPFLEHMLEQQWLGDKTGQGFYKKTRSTDGGKKILALNLKSLEYEEQAKTKFPLLDPIRQEENLTKRLPLLVQMPDQAGEFYRINLSHMFRYASLHAMEVAEELYRIDDAMMAGFGWQMGPFASWDAVGVQQMIQLMKLYGTPPAIWVDEMLDRGCDTFYRFTAEGKEVYQPSAGSYLPVPGSRSVVRLELLRGTNTLWKNAGCSVIDIGEGILNLEFHTKMNTLGSEIISGFHQAVNRAEKDFRGLVIGNEGEVFSAGANLGMVFMLAVEQEYEELDMAIRAFQQFTMRARYSSIPVVVAPRGLTLGGGCELTLHADAVQAAAETYIGLVELGVGVIPGGGGTKEMALRISDRLQTGEVPYAPLQKAFMNIATAKVATSAYEAFDLDYLRRGDRISVNERTHLTEARQLAIDLAEAGYCKPAPRKDVMVQGRGGMALFMAGINGMRMGNYISDHDRKAATKLAYVICGGDLSQPQPVSEQYLLDLEREAFLSLLGEKKTLERIQSVLKTGKPLRN
ncbi:MAG: 3-hydroxyacyl-CoA dehydrogenase [Sphingomonadales bacterium]|nr:3-hydroxyacyl-CoA dehydrogenase [Sphingomonadales bacterium]